MKILVDTREQCPWEFDTETVRKALSAGDYSLEGLENKVAIERKSLDDLVQTVIHQRERFHAELKKLQTMQYACVVVEGNFEDLFSGKYRSQAHPNSIFGSVLSIIVDCNVPVYFCSNRQIACHFAKTYLSRVSKKETQHDL